MIPPTVETQTNVIKGNVLETKRCQNQDSILLWSKDFCYLSHNFLCDVGQCFSILNRNTGIRSFRFPDERSFRPIKEIPVCVLVVSQTEERKDVFMVRMKRQRTEKKVFPALTRRPIIITGVSPCWIQLNEIFFTASVIRVSWTYRPTSRRRGWTDAAVRVIDGSRLRRIESFRLFIEFHNLQFSIFVTGTEI